MSPAPQDANAGRRLAVNLFAPALGILWPPAREAPDVRRVLGLMLPMLYGWLSLRMYAFGSLPFDVLAWYIFILILPLALTFHMIGWLVLLGGLLKELGAAIWQRIAFLLGTAVYGSAAVVSLFVKGIGPAPRHALNGVILGVLAGGFLLGLGLMQAFLSPGRQWRRGPLLASLGPLVGLLGLGRFSRGQRSAGLRDLVAGVALLVVFYWTQAIAATDSLTITILLGYASYLALVGYFLLWAYSVGAAWDALAREDRDHSAAQTSEGHSPFV